MRTTSRRHRKGRGAPLIAAALCAAFGAAYLVMAWRIIFTLRIGPVVAVIDEAHGHGVHSGDMLGLGAAILGVLLLFASTVLLDEGVRPARRLATVHVLPVPRRAAVHRRPAAASYHRPTAANRRVWSRSPIAA